jgi:hypothetical protein
VVVKVFLALLLVVLCVLSVRRRARVRALLADLPMETKPSIISAAIMELIAVAGGVYIALTAVTSFLAVEVPDRVLWMGLRFNPLAAISMLVAVVLPFTQPEPQVSLGRAQETLNRHLPGGNTRMRRTGR